MSLSKTISSKDKSSTKKEQSSSKLQIESLVNDLSSNNLSYAIITVIVSYSYTCKESKYSINAEVININRISLNSILEGLSKFIALDPYSVSYCENDSRIYYFCGNYPFEYNILCELTETKTVWVKLRQNVNRVNTFSADLYEDDTENLNQDDKKTHHYINKNSKRAKERNIGEIIKKVFYWKKIYEGIQDKKGNTVKMTLEEAAKKVDISKKSLDEYHNQIKFGNLFGFDFNKHKDSKVGVLRGFVKKQFESIDCNSNNVLLSKKRKKVKTIKKTKKDISSTKDNNE